MLRITKEDSAVSLEALFSVHLTNIWQEFSVFNTCHNVDFFYIDIFIFIYLYCHFHVKVQK